MTSVIRGRGRRCDARCYDGASPRDACRCICGGRNHGVGLRRAAAQRSSHGQQSRTEARPHHAS
jgi:hypothetical protein